MDHKIHCIHKPKTTTMIIAIKYEYIIKRIDHGYSEIETINEMVNEGYRLIAVAPYYGGNSLYFERPKQQQ